MWLKLLMGIISEPHLHFLNFLQDQTSVDKLKPLKLLILPIEHFYK